MHTYTLFYLEFGVVKDKLVSAKRVTRDNRKNAEYHVVAAIKKLRTHTNCPVGKSWPNPFKNEQHIGSEKTYGPQYWKVEHNDAKDCKRKCFLFT